MFFLFRCERPRSVGYLLGFVGWVVQTSYISWFGLGWFGLVGEHAVGAWERMAFWGVIDIEHVI